MGDGGFGAELGVRRRAAGISQRVLADRAGVSVAAIRDLEQGRTRRPRPALVDALVAVLALTGDAEATFRRRAAPGDHTATPGDRAAEPDDRAAAPDDRAAAPDDTPATPGDHTAVADHDVSAGPGGDQPVRVQILGPLQVRRGAGTVPVGRGRRRAVLGRLALSVNDAVPVADLVDLLWDADPPPAPAHAVQTHLSRLRAALRTDPTNRADGTDHADVVRRTPGGYQLDLTGDQVDLTRFRDLVRRARTAEPAAALELLETGLALWRGDALQDVPQLRDHPLTVAVQQERVAAVLRHADLALAAGQPDRCLPQLRALAAASPLHEPLHARLIAALAAGNLQAAALDAYTGIRRRLVEELGIEPSPELAEAHRRVLLQEHTPAQADRAGVPAQLPADLGRFSGRAAALARLDAVLDAHERTGAGTVVIVSGTAGVGKTALAVHWAHRARHRFPDGQLHVNLRGFHPIAAPVSPGEALHGFLLALGVDPLRVPAGEDAQSALLRTLLADRRVLIVLDNARDAGAVRPLLPGAPGCLVLVTSRHELTGLAVTEGAHQVPLGLLDGVEARDLLAQRLGAGRAAAEPDAVAAIAGRCAGLPLALAVAAARAGTRPDAPLADLAAELAGDGGGLDAFATGDPGTDVRAVLSCSYRTLGDDAARLFRLVGLHPGTDISVAAAAGAAGLPVAAAQRLLRELTGANLMARSADRFTMHDLLHAYAADRAHAEDPAPARQAALDRLLEHYATGAETACRVLFDAGAAGDDLSPAAARAWLDAERANIVALAVHGARDGRPRHTTALAAAVHRYLDSGHFADALVLHTHALEAARGAGDRAAEAAALNQLGAADRRAGRYAQAAAWHEQSLAIHRAVDDHAGAARTLSYLGETAWRLGDYPLARQQHQAALDLYRAIGDRLGEATQLNMFGIGTRQNGDHEQAIALHSEAMRLLRDLGHRLGEAHVLNSLGTCYQHTGEHQRAVDALRRAIGIYRELGHGPGEAGALNNLGHAYLRLGRPAAAVEHHRRALAVYRGLGERDFEVEALNGLGAAHLAAGDVPAALEAFTGALRLAERGGDRHEQAVAHDGLAGLHDGTGDGARAAAHWRRALDIYTALGLPDAARVAARLASRP